MDATHARTTALARPGLLFKRLTFLIGAVYFSFIAVTNTASGNLS